MQDIAVEREILFHSADKSNHPEKPDAGRIRAAFLYSLSIELYRGFPTMMDRRSALKHLGGRLARCFLTKALRAEGFTNGQNRRSNPPRRQLGPSPCRHCPTPRRIGAQLRRRHHASAPRQSTPGLCKQPERCCSRAFPELAGKLWTSWVTNRELLAESARTCRPQPRRRARQPLLLVAYAGQGRRGPAGELAKAIDARFGSLSRLPESSPRLP